MGYNDQLEVIRYPTLQLLQPCSWYKPFSWHDALNRKEKGQRLNKKKGQGLKTRSEIKKKKERSE